MSVRLACLALLILLRPTAASAQRTLLILDFHADIEVHADGSIVVEETIVPRFTGTWNGIFRTIPVQYRTPQGLNYTLRLDIESVTDDEGRELRYESSRERHYRKLKIWVPGATDSTKRVKLRYRVPNALRFFDEHDELYWNVTGDEWDVPIAEASARVRLPDGVTGIRATAFRGVYGSTQQAGVLIEPGAVQVEATALGFREGVTVVVGWDPGIVHRPTVAERTVSALYSNLPLALPPLVLLGMWRLWRARGRDPELAPISTQYEPPPNLSPAELGTLVDGSPDMRDITATLVDLAVRGYVHITETKEDHLFGLYSSRDYTFTVRPEAGEWSALKVHEVKLLSAMFGNKTSVKLSELKNKFYRHLPGLREHLYTMLVKDGFYTGRPDRVRAIYIIGGVVVGVLIASGSGTLMSAFGMQPAAGVIAGILSGLIVVVVFGWLMPARTMRGTRELEKVLGFQEFLSRVEGDRLERMVRTPEMFEKYLPYAMALGVEDNWAKAFEDIYTQPPSWYTGSAGVHTFRPSTLTSNLGAMSSAAATAMASSPRGSGGSGFSGGSSGGGFGGGGGGGF